MRFHRVYLSEDIGVDFNNGSWKGQMKHFDFCTLSCIILCGFRYQNLDHFKLVTGVSPLDELISSWGKRFSKYV